ncbi:glycosyltransferase [Solidesulfovibrio sp.]|uniref:glycosyltransferase n=1 Tax=Solidesulfovibrio sp. TaxID=2910990 RepID=UPI002B1E9780|nr:glycosyltransferase [Solidesulfovibrio sp.]MEA4858229.1 glycosyltransferase [Solidesulfovibrio sp.]
MKVLQVGKFYPPDPGGVETATRQAVEQLLSLGASVEVLCFAGPGPYDGASAPCPVHRAPVAATIASQPLSAAYVRAFLRLAPRFDVLHLHWPNPLAALAAFLARPRAKIVLTWHSDIIGKGALAAGLSPLEAWLCRRADLVVAPSPVHLEASNRATLFAGKGAVVPFCVDAAMARPESADPAAVAAIRARLGGRRLIFTLGRLVPYKGFDVLVDAAARLPENAVTVIGGGGPMREALAARIAASGLGERVLLPGRIPDAALAAWLAACDVFCLPSVTRAEMFGIVQLEAMAFGKPVVSTAIPGSGVPWVNADGRTGLTVPPGDAPALALALSRLLADDALRQRLGRGGREAVAGRFSPAAVAAALAAAYARLV